MSSVREYQGDAAGEAGDEHTTASVTPKSRQPNGSTGEQPVRRSWRPCQMLHQDGEMNPQHHHHHHRHHHHHPPHHHQHPAGRGPPRHRRRPPSGQGQSQDQAQSPGVEPPVFPSRSDRGENQDADHRPVQQHRPAVTRYRRHGDPNPRLRNHRQRQPFREIQESSPAVDERVAPAEVQHSPTVVPATDQSQDRGSPHMTPVAVVTPTHVSAGPELHNLQHLPQVAFADAEEDLHEHKADHEEQSKEVEEDEGEREQVADEGHFHSTAGQSSCSHDDKGEGEAERVEEDREVVIDNPEEDPAAQGSEITDPCSDTESAASLSMDGPLHSPPPLHSPTPPSSPDVPPFPQLDHFSEDIGMSSPPDNEPVPDEEEEDDCSESCSLSHSTSCSESYPKTYADFYTESHQKSYTEPIYESYSEPKSHPSSFPEPLKTSYPREPCQQSGRVNESNKAQQESCLEPFTNHRLENVRKGAPSSSIEGSYHTARQSRDRCSRHSPVDRSVGCRLHHYDGQSDSEGDSADKSPLSKSGRQSPRQPQTQTKTLSPGQTSSREVHNERNVVGLSGEAAKGSGDAISLAIKDIKEAIEGVKTKTVRSPYTPDQPVEPIWVMRQEISPMEDVYPLQATTGHVSMTSLIIRYLLISSDFSTHFYPLLNCLVFPKNEMCQTEPPV